MRYRLFLILFLFSAASYGAEAVSECTACGVNAPETKPVNAKTADILKSLADIETKTCQDVVNSAECKEVYKEIQLDGQDLKDYKRDCGKEDGDNLVEKFIQKGKNQWACALGLFDGSFGTAGRFIGEFVAERITDKEIDDTCNSEVKNKRFLYIYHNLNVPENLKLKIPSDQKLNAYSCSDIKRAIFEENRYQNLKNQRAAGIKTTEKEIQLIQLAKDKLHELGIKSECYSTQKVNELVCKTVATVALAVVPAAAVLKLKMAAGFYRAADGALVASRAKAGAQVAQTATSLPTRTTKAAELSSGSKPVAEAEESSERLRQTLNTMKDEGYTLERRHPVSVDKMKTELNASQVRIRTAELDEATAAFEKTKLKSLLDQRTKLRELAAKEGTLPETLAKAREQLKNVNAQIKEASGSDLALQDKIVKLKLKIKDLKEKTANKTIKPGEAAEYAKEPSSQGDQSTNPGAISSVEYDVRGGKIDLEKSEGMIAKDRGVVVTDDLPGKAGEFDHVPKRVSISSNNSNPIATLNHELTHGRGVNTPTNPKTGLPQNKFDFYVGANKGFAQKNKLTGYELEQHGSEATAFRSGALQNVKDNKYTSARFDLKRSNSAVDRSLKRISAAKESLKKPWVNLSGTNRFGPFVEGDTTFYRYRLSVNSESGEGTHYFEVQSRWKTGQPQPPTPTKEDLARYLDDIEKAQLRTKALNDADLARLKNLDN